MSLIYIVDDSKIIADIIKKIVSSISGTTAVEFYNGESMLEKLKEQTPDMIFLDYYLNSNDDGVMNGEDVFKEVKKKHPQMPVIMLTGMHDQGKLEEMKKIGVDHIIHKDRDDIFSDVVQCVERHLS